MQKNNQCCHLHEVVKAEMEIIAEHLENHKWFKHIGNDNDAIADFIKDYGWLMREMYCNYACPDKEECQLRKNGFSHENYWE